MVTKKAPAKKVAKKAKKTAPVSDLPSPNKLTKGARTRARATLRQNINTGRGNRKPLAKGSIRKASEMPKYKVIPTGSPQLDYALGVGGLVRGRMTEIWGSPGMGKTSMSLIMIASAQKAYPDEVCGFIDVEHTFDPALASRLGVDLNMIDVFVPHEAEEVADICKEMLRSKIYSLVVLDSIGAMIPRVDMDKDSADAVMATQAKIVTRMVKIAVPECDNSNTALLVINQVRADLGGYGDGLTTAGGYTLTHMSTHRIRVKSGGKGSLFRIKVEGEEFLAGKRIALKVERNKVAPPEKVARVCLYLMPSVSYGPVGTRPAEEALSLGMVPSVGAVQRHGSGYVMPDGEIFRGEAKALAYLEENPDVIETIRRIAIKSVADMVTLDGEFSDAPPLEEEILDVGDDVDEDGPGPVEEESVEVPELKGSGTPVFRKAVDEIDTDEFPTNG